MGVMNAGRALKRARRKAGLSQRALADLVDLPQSTIGRIEAGMTDPRVSTMNKLLAACGQRLEASRRLGEGVDRTLIRQMLSLSPLQRLEHGLSASKGVRRLLEKAKRL